MKAVQISRTKNNVIVNMRFICMRSHNIRMLSFQKPGSQFIADLVGILRSNFSRLK